MAKTKLLPPEIAVKIAWGLTGEFCDSPHSKKYASSAELELEGIKNRAKDNVLEKEYVSRVIVAIYANMRNLDTIYKWRNLNFNENKKLRDVYLENAQENAATGIKAGEVIKSIPTMTFTGAGGITLAQFFDASDILSYGFGLFAAGLGAAAQIYALRRFRRKEIWNYIRQDYERNLYYQKYLEKVTIILTHLYKLVSNIHIDVFDEEYSSEGGSISFEEFLAGIQPKFCQYIHKHLNDKKYKKRIKADIWVLCETNSEIAERFCPHFETPYYGGPYIEGTYEEGPYE